MDLRNKKKKELVAVKRKYKQTIKLATNVEPSTTTIEEAPSPVEEAAPLPAEATVVKPVKTLLIVLNIFNQINEANSDLKAKQLLNMVKS